MTNDPSPTRALFHSLPLVLAVLAVPIVPFVLLGGRLDESVQHFAESTNRAEAAAVIIGVLAVDIFLPIPSSMISTLAGMKLGWLLGTLASWIGMTIGSTIGFAFARWFGPTFTRWFVKPTSLAQMHTLTERYGPRVIVLTRGLPILAEATVLLLGLERLAWRKFLPPLLLSNLGLSLVYALFGHFAAQWDATPLAIAVSILLPVLVAVVVQRRSKTTP
jgi:uncharacterized membrane protein YdjX (TVP38/TMEM64 family)